MKQVFLSSLIFSIVTNGALFVADITIKTTNGRGLESASFFIDSFGLLVVGMFFISLIGGFFGMAVVAALSSKAKISRIQESMVYAAVTYAILIGVEYILMGFRDTHIGVFEISQLFCVIVSHSISYFFVNKKRIDATCS